MIANSARCMRANSVYKIVQQFGRVQDYPEMQFQPFYIDDACRTLARLCVPSRGAPPA
jgi:hypothetical protein